LKTVVFAYHNMGLIGLEALVRHGYDIAAVFTHEDDPGENCWFGSVKKWAQGKGIKVYTTEEVNSPQWIEEIAAMRQDGDIFFLLPENDKSAAFLICPVWELLIYHGSLLPAYRGRCPVNWVLINGENKQALLFIT